MFAVALRKQGLKLPYSERWFKQYEQKILEDPTKSTEIELHRKIEMAFVLKNLLTSEGEIKIHRHEIKLDAEFEFTQTQVDLA